MTEMRDEAGTLAEIRAMLPGVIEAVRSGRGRSGLAFLALRDAQAHLLGGRVALAYLRLTEAMAYVEGADGSLGFLTAEALPGEG